MWPKEMKAANLIEEMVFNRAKRRKRQWYSTELKGGNSSRTQLENWERGFGHCY